jgi:hypothetical protein
LPLCENANLYRFTELKESIHMRNFIHAIGFCALALVLSACGAGSNGPVAGPVQLPAGNPNPPTTYAAGGQIAIPGIPPASGIFSFDIGFVDPVARVYLLADRNNKGVDVVDLTSLTFQRVAGGGTFTGLGIGTPAAANTGGPNGVASVGGGILFAGDGDSTTKVINFLTGATLANIPMVNPVTTPQLQLAGTQCNATGTPTTGAANLRADELAYDPRDNVVLIINDASCPAFGTFISSVAPYNVLGSVAFTTATAGAEQPTWDPTQGKFLMALPATIANPGGEIDVIDPKTFAITNKFSEPGSCKANGTALGPNETLFLGCSSIAPLVLMNAATGATIATVPNTGGCDEVWFNPIANRFYAACSNFTTPAIFVVGLTGNLIATIPTAIGGAAHSVAVDPAVDRIFYPQRAGTIGLLWSGH